MIPEDHRDAIVTNGLHFMRSITEAYGSDKGLELWEQITSVLDPEVKGQIFFAMITGEYNNRILLKGTEEDVNPVWCIKAIRAYTKLGLKEAKDVVEGVPCWLKKEVKKEEAEEIERKLKEAGAELRLV